MAVMDEYQRGFAPSDLILSEKNSGAMLVYAIEKYGLVSISYLIEAEQTLGASLDRVPPPKKLTQDEIAEAFRKREFVRIQRETAENAVPFQDRFTTAEKTKKATEDWATGQEKARADLGFIIMNYQCYGINHVDIGATEMVQTFLKGIAVPSHDNGVDGQKIDYIATAQWVRAVISELPDHPRIGDPGAALQRVREKFAAQQEVKKNRSQAW
jgi:hypothetical protein